MSMLRTTSKTRGRAICISMPPASDVGDGSSNGIGSNVSCSYAKYTNTISKLPCGGCGTHSEFLTFSKLGSRHTKHRTAANELRSCRDRVVHTGNRQGGGFACWFMSCGGNAWIVSGMVDMLGWLRTQATTLLGVHGFGMA